MQQIFDPERVAYFEQAGWQAYYARNWPRAFWLMVNLNREQFGMPWPMAVGGALDIVRAGRAFAPAVGNDVPAATTHLTRFFRKVRFVRPTLCSARTLAELEMTYWLVHRRLAVARTAARGDGEIGPMVEALAQLHAALFDATPSAMHRSAELRSLAAVTVDRITACDSTDVAGDWQRVLEHLAAAYRAVLAASAEPANQKIAV